MSPLEETLIGRIRAGGPITVADYMAAALVDPDHGYYRRANPVGASGDFITAPEISQVFGELIGAWMISCWQQLGCPDPVRLVELGPGRGTLLADTLRVGRFVPAWLAAIELHLVEINPLLRRAQEERLGHYRPTWHDTPETVRRGPMLLVANEFLDALPIRQLAYRNRAWRERLIGWSAERGFHFVIAQAPSALSLLIPTGLESAAEGAIFELSPAAIDLVARLSRRLVADGGAALLIDYGRSSTDVGDTLQAMHEHRMVQSLAAPGQADLSAHVDFSAVNRTAREAGADVYGPVTQTTFLKTLGIDARADTLKSAASSGQSELIDLAVRRLTDPSEMGELFKALAISAGGIIPPGFPIY